jgi:hypothetical protein
MSAPALADTGSVGGRTTRRIDPLPRRDRPNQRSSGLREQGRAMKATAVVFASFDQLRDYVVQVLCERQDLDPHQYPAAQVPLVRWDRPCGLLFIQSGPRQLRLVAVWDWEQNMVAFYDCDGTRFRVDRVSVQSLPEGTARPAA